MALIHTGAGVAQASGKLGGIVFSHNRAGAYIRARSVPVQPRTIYQLQIRSAVSSASSSWLDLTDAERAAWSAWAQANPVPNRLGDMVRLQGNAAYVEVNARQLFLGQALITTPPTVQAPTPLASMTVTADIGSGTTTIVFATSPLGTGEHLYVRGALIPSVGIGFVANKLRFVTLSAAAATTPFDYQTAFEARLGALSVGKVVALMVSVYDSATGLLSAPLRAQVPVTDTP